MTIFTKLCTVSFIDLSNKVYNLLQFFLLVAQRRILHLYLYHLSRRKSGLKTWSATVQLQYHPLQKNIINYKRCQFSIGYENSFGMAVAFMMIIAKLWNNGVGTAADFFAISRWIIYFFDSFEAILFWVPLIFCSKKITS